MRVAALATGESVQVDEKQPARKFVDRHIRSQTLGRLVHRWRFVLGVLAWLGALSIPIVWVAYNELLGDLACERLDSEYGYLSWSWLPPGRVCRFDAEPEYGLPAETVGPHPHMSIYLVLLLAAGVALLRLRRKNA